MAHYPGYTVLRTEDCPEQHDTLTLLTHDVSGAAFLPVYMNLKMARSVWMEKTVRLLINHLRTHRTMVSVLYIRKLTFVRT